MTTKTEKSREIIEQLETIEIGLRRHYNTYEHASRHSQEHTAAWRQIKNLEAKRSLLEAELEAVCSSRKKAVRTDYRFTTLPPVD